MHPSRIVSAAFVIALLVTSVPVFADQAPSTATAPATSQPSGPPTLDAHIRREPVLPVSFPDYQLVELDLTKEVVFHVGNQTVVAKIPILAYIPVTRAGRASAVEHLAEARRILVTAAAGPQVTTNDLAAVRDLIEKSLSDLRIDASVVTKNGSK
jgi:hypothetical protein